MNELKNIRNIDYTVVFARDSYWNGYGPAMGNINNPGPHGFSEVLYAYTSAAGTRALRTAIAALEGVEPDEVQVVTGHWALWM